MESAQRDEVTTVPSSLICVVKLFRMFADDKRYNMRDELNPFTVNPNELTLEMTYRPINLCRNGNKV
jgi:hypothetical protein